MGLYNDNQHTNRTAWEFTYTGAELLAAARIKHREFFDKEKAARAQMSTFMVDMNVAQSDGILQCKKDIEYVGSEGERCTVWIHEFSRKPEQKYVLELNTGRRHLFRSRPRPDGITAGALASIAHRGK